MVVRVIKTKTAHAEDTWTIIGPNGPLASFAMPTGSEREDIEEAVWETVPEPYRIEKILMEK